MRALLLLCTLLAPEFIHANGTPIDRSDVNATGSIRMVLEGNVALESETLHVVMDGDWAAVRAEYHLANRGAASTVTYGFPIDHVNQAWCNDCDEPSEEDRIKAGEPVRDVRIEVDGQSMPTREIKEAAGEGAAPPPTLRTWVVTDLPFGDAQSRVVTVSYRVRNRLDDWLWSTSFAPAFSPRTFRYLLSPSGNWGDGKVRKLAISVDISALESSGAVIKTIAPAGYTTHGGALNWQFTDFDLSRAADLEIVYDDTARLLSEYVAEYRLLPKETASHDVSKMFDGDLNTAWCEGAQGDGTGETLTFEFDSVTVDGIGIVNGYTKSQDVYLGNGRVKRLAATVEDQDGTRQAIANLPQRDLGRWNRKAIGSFIDWIEDINPAFKPTRKITLTIAEVQSGAKHADTCIAEIYFVGSRL